MQTLAATNPPSRLGGFQIGDGEATSGMFEVTFQSALEMQYSVEQYIWGVQQDTFRRLWKDDSEHAYIYAVEFYENNTNANG